MAPLFDIEGSPAINAAAEQVEEGPKVGAVTLSVVGTSCNVR